MELDREIRPSDGQSSAREKFSSIIQNTIDSTVRKPNVCRTQISTEAQSEMSNVENSSIAGGRASHENFFLSTSP